MTHPHTKETTSDDRLAEAVSRANSLFKEERSHYRIKTGAIEIMNAGGYALLAGGIVFPADVKELAHVMSETLKSDVVPGVRLNQLGLFSTGEKWPGTDRPAYFDATVLSVNQFGYVSSVGEMITEDEMKRRQQERSETRSALGPDDSLLLAVSMTKAGEPVTSDLAFDFINSQYVLPAGRPVAHLTAINS